MSAQASSVFDGSNAAVVEIASEPEVGVGLPLGLNVHQGDDGMG